MFATPIIPQADQDRELPRSPWYRDWRVAAALKSAEANGAIVEDERAYFGSDYADEALGDEWFLDVDFGTAAWVHVRYSSDAGMWRLEVDTMTGVLQGNTIEDHMAAAIGITNASKLCRDLNTLVLRERARMTSTDALSDEVTAMLIERDLTPQDLAAALGVTYTSVMSRLIGRTKWSAVDLLRLSRLFGCEGLDRLVAAVES